MGLKETSETVRRDIAENARGAKHPVTFWASLVGSVVIGAVVGFVVGVIAGITLR